jgi:ribosomal protein S27E
MSISQTNGLNYERHRPEKTVLYQIISEYYPLFREHLDDQGATLPEFVQREFEDFLQCGRLENGFIRVACEDCKHERLVAFSCKRRGFCSSCGARRMAESSALLIDEVLPRQPMRQWVLSFPYPLRFLLASRPEVLSKVLGIVYRTISTHLIKKAGHTKKTAQTGAVTLIQRFGSALNLNPHLHFLVLDGVFTNESNPKFIRTKAPTADELNKLVNKISHRVARSLERQGLLQQDAENSYLNLDTDEQPMDQLIGNSITYRIAIGPNQGHKVFTLQTLPPQPDEPSTARVAKVAGFSLHAGVMAEAHQRDKLERLCRYISRPAIAEKRLSITNNGQIRYQLKTPYRNGTTHVIFEPLDFMAKLAALVPKPRVNLTRFHGVFAPNHTLRDKVTPGKRKRKQGEPHQQDIKSPTEKRASMTWAQRLKRVFNMDIEICNQCGGKVNVIACIEDPVVIRKILDHLDGKTSKEKQAVVPECRAPPQYDLFY